MSARTKKHETARFTVKKFSPRRTRSSELSSSQSLRVLRDLRGEQSNLIVTHFSHESLKNQKNRRRAFAVLSFLSLLFFASAGLAQTLFYQGKTITIIRGSAPGGVGEMRTRAVANYLKKHVPGNPTILIEFMPGAGGIKAANHLYRGARTDGLVIGSAPKDLHHGRGVGRRRVRR
jgi:hypothetical protein